MAAPQLLLATLLSITCGAFAQQGQLPTGMKIQGTKKNVQAPQVVNKLQTNQEPGALVPGPPPVPTLNVSIKHLSKPPNMAEALVTVPLAKKKKKTVEEKKIDDLKLTKEEKVKLFPCEDYSPICHYYQKDSQCRDYYMQKGCRKYCGLCDVPYGVFIGCADWKVCKKFAKSACMIRWVRETCKSKCGQCNHYERKADANIFIGKKRYMVDSKQHDDNKQQLKKVLTKTSRKESVSKDKKRKDLEKTAKASLHPKVTVVEKAVPKTKETHVEDNNKGSGAQSKVDSTKENSKDENNDNDDDNDDDDDDDDGADDEKKEGMERNDERNSKDDDDDNDNDDKSKQAKVMKSTSSSHDKPVNPVKMDADPRGEPVVTKVVDQPVKFNQKPNKELKVKVVKQDKDRKPAKVAKPKISDKKAVTPKKVEHDKIAKIKPVQKMKKSDKAKTKATASKMQKN